MPEDNKEAAPKIALTEVNLPEIDPAFGYLLELYFLSGQVSQSGMGISPITWEELKAFREENELDICIWERGILKQMSEAYCAEYSASTSSKIDRPAPYEPEREEDEIEAVALATSLRDALAVFRKR